MGILTQALERKAVDFTDYLVDLSRSVAGVVVTEDTALRATAVYACIRVISEDVATIPLLMYERQEPRGKRRAPEHPLYEVLHNQANPEMTALQLRETLTAHAVGWGNGYAYIVRDNRGNARELWPLLPDRTRPVRDPATQQLYYEVRETPELKKASSWKAQSRDVLHIVGLGFDGLMGYSPIRLHAQSIGLMLAAEEFGARFFGQGLHLGGFFEHPNTLSDPAYDRLKTQVNEQKAGLRQSHSWMILEEGMKYQQLAIPPDEAQFVESRKLQVSEIARIFRVPPHKIGDLERATFSNIEHQAIDYVVSTLRPWLVRWEQAIWQKLLTPADRRRFFAEHLVEGLLRGDTQSRYAAYQIGRQGEWLSPDDIREFENMNPRPDGAGGDYTNPNTRARESQTTAEAAT